MHPFIRKIANTLMPQPCICCRRKLKENERYLCDECMGRLGRNLYVHDLRDNMMAHLFWRVFEIERATAPFLYKPETIITLIVRRMKYRGRKRMARFFGAMLAERVKDSGMFDGIDAMLPVPLTADRQSSRGFNQSEELCRGINDVTGIPIVSDVLIRLYFYGSQTMLSAEERRDNVAGCFTARNKDSIEGMHVLIVDDVVTTGATVSECIGQIADVPGIRISVLSLAWSHA